MGSLEAAEYVGGQVVVTASLHRRQAPAQASEREGVVADGADVVLGLPHPAAPEARARVQGVDDAPPEEISGGRRLGQVAVSGGLPEQQPKARAGRDKARRRRE